MLGGSDSPLDSTPLLDGQNTPAGRMAGGSMFSSQRDFNLVCIRLDSKHSKAAAFELMWTRKDITHKLVPFGHGSVLLQNAKHIQFGETNHRS
jgi:hypothetical protein